MKRTALALIIYGCLQAAAFHHLPTSKHTSRAYTTFFKNSQHVWQLYSVSPESTEQEQKKRKSRKEEEEVSKFLTDFTTAQGNLVDPYKVLNIPRTASSVEIKQSYRKLSRKWHPDAVARKEILPGKW